MSGFSSSPTAAVTARTTATLFRVLAVPPHLGRWFEEDEDRPGGGQMHERPPRGGSGVHEPIAAGDDLAPQRLLA